MSDASLATAQAPGRSIAPEWEDAVLLHLRLLLRLGAEVGTEARLPDVALSYGAMQGPDPLDPACVGRSFEPSRTMANIRARSSRISAVRPDIVGFLAPA